MNNNNRLHGKAARHSSWTTEPRPWGPKEKLVNVFIVLRESQTEGRTVITAYKDKAKAEKFAEKKTAESANGETYCVIHTPVNA